MKMLIIMALAFGLAASPGMVLSQECSPPLSATQTECSMDVSLAVWNNYIIVAQYWYFEVLEILAPDQVRPISYSDFALGDDDTHIAAADGYLYVSSWFGFEIQDIANPSTPVLVAAYPSWDPQTPLWAGPNIRNFDLRGNRFCTIGNGYLNLVGLEDPVSPYAIGRTPIATTTRWVAIDGAIAVTSGNGLNIFDISTDADPVLLGSIAGTTGDLVVENGYVYVELKLPDDPYKYLGIYDISIPSTPILVGTARLGGWNSTWPGELVKNGNYVYTREYMQGIRTIDVSIATNPHVVDCVDEPITGWAWYYPIALWGVYPIYLGLGLDDRPSVIVADGQYCQGIFAVPGATAQSTFYRESASGRELVIQLRNETLPQSLALQVQVPPDCKCAGEAFGDVKLVPRSGTGRIYDVAVYNGDSYVVDFYIDNNTAPDYYDLQFQCASGDIQQLPTGIKYEGYTGYTPIGRLYNSLTGNTIRGAGVALQRWQTTPTTGWYTVETAIAGDGTYSFSPTEPGTYQILIEYDLSGQQVRGPFEVAAGSAALKSSIPYEDTMLEPVSNDEEPPTITYGANTGTSGIAYVVDGIVGLAVVETVTGTADSMVVLVEPFTIGGDSVVIDYRLVDGARTGRATVLCVDQLGNFAEYNLGLGCVAGDCDCNGAADADEIAVRPGLDWNSDGILDRCQQGLADTPDRPLGSERNALYDAYPNPFNPTTSIAYEVVAGAHVRIEIYDLAGRLVRRLVDDRSAGGGRQEVGWDGRDARGRILAAGVYFYRFSTDGYSETKRMVLVK